MSLKFSSFSEFLETTADDDREFLRNGEFSKIPAVACALANSSGGWIILGAERDWDGEINITGFENKNVIVNVPIPHGISFSFQKFLNIIIIYIAPLEWHKRPILFEGMFYRRVEGVNLTSSAKSAAIIASDAQDFSRDDEPAMNFFINPDSLNDFYGTVLKFHDEYKNFSVGEFLCRSFIFSGKYLTRAGALMFGNIIKIKAVLNYSGAYAELEENNIWDAYKNILPRLVNKLSSRCSEAFQEIFINALLHADYHAGNVITVRITSDPPKVLIKNPGIIRDGTRNHRLKKIFELAKISRKRRGLETIKKYMPSFKLEQDMLNFCVASSLELEGIAEFSGPARIL